ncbi:collagen alpha-1(XIV) chain-like [Crassostrea angulata]|uniref:collagen alpha-1(XIV) chain-like n=1 Tax=Magallana angulata TaxID=2784310 RepID=UPI0022B14772|nr:collagen alpha-1(XIV) chain-like [Crassostrea angulata]
MKFEGTVFVGCFVLICVSAVYKDVVYVMDRSGSVKEADFDESVDFVYNVTEYLAIGTSEMQVSIVIFSSSHSEEFDLNDFTSKADLLNAIKNLRGTRTTGKTYTYDAIDYVKDNSFTSAKGGRSGANRTVVILTDGLSNNFTRTVTAADELRAGLGAEVFAIGIGSTVSKSNDELKGIASDPDSYYVHYIDTFVYLCNLIPALVPKLDSTVTPSLLADCPTPPSSTQESTTAAATTTGSTSGNTDLATATTTVTTSETTSKSTETSTSSITTDSATTVIQTTRVGTTLAAIGTTQIIQKTGDQSPSSQPSGSSSNTAAIAAGAALGALAAAATLIVSASLLRRWHLSTKEDPMVLAAVNQYQQAPIGPSKASFSFA